MSKITLKLKEPPKIQLEAECLSPDVFAELSHEEICASPVYHGKRRRRLDDYFTITGERSDNVHIYGDLRRVKWIGRAMTRGSLTVYGGVGMHLGAYMGGGRIEVHGDAGDWIGAEMTHGFIRVHGDAGGQVGAAYRGSMAGMRNGVIMIGGSAGLEVGMRMRRGSIIIGGRVRDFAGLQMKGGTIVLLSGAEIRTGAWMMRGTIISLQPLALLPTFSYACRYSPDIVRVLARDLQPHGVTLPYAAHHGAYDLYQGDSSAPGKGEILIWRPADTA
ncbi:formylmethanofuran dehydrogenase subunit C [Lignipirellula cremea]|uniref:Formyltransferase/hydrolase complex Fhc subunit C n=1 Tax=Lignipirellula cremea TaxID=2528010 RepID=A0A518DTN2_9BACT|nr:formylmethanofuran dehydrogenase subunit C [Lignipirellula cremea]QDU95195.1 Formyltransferase/hydrolase complex Fhc subunit C [Lignipirellula cremea]